MAGSESGLSCQSFGQLVEDSRDTISAIMKPVTLTEIFSNVEQVHSTGIRTSIMEHRDTPLTT